MEAFLYFAICLTLVFLFFYFTGVKEYYGVLPYGNKFVVYKKQGVFDCAKVYYMTPAAIKDIKTNHKSYAIHLPWGYMVYDSLMFDTMTKAEVFIEKAKNEDKKGK